MKILSQGANHCIGAFFVLAAAVLVAPGAFADPVTVEAGALKSLQESFEEISNQWFTPLQEIARNLLYATAVAGLTWRILPLVIQGADLSETLWIVVQHTIVIGLYLALINNAPEWTGMIIDGFKDSAAAAEGRLVGEPLQASTIVARGVEIAGKYLESSGWNFFGKLNPMRLIVGLLIVLIYCAVAGVVLLVIAEVYLMSCFGVLMLGFAGIDLTSDISRRYILYILSIGAKVYALFLVVGIGNRLINDWVPTLGGEVIEGFVVVGVLVMMLQLATMLPNMIQGLVNSASLDSGSPSVMGLGAGVASMAAAGGMKTLAAGSGLKAAAGLTAAQRGAASVGEALKGGGVKGLASFAGGTLKNITSAAGAAAVGKATGDRSSSINAVLKGRKSAALASRIQGSESSISGRVGPERRGE